MTDWVPLVVIPLLAALLVVVLCLAVLTLRGRRPHGTWHTITNVVEAPDEPNIYLVLSLDRLGQLYEQTPGAAFNKTREEETETTTSGGAGVGGVKADVGRKSTSRERTTPTEVTSPQKAVAVERRLLSEGRTQCLDLITPGDEGPILGLLEALQSEARRIGLTVPPVVTTALEQAWQEKSRSAPAPNLRSVGPLVSIRAEFAVCDGAEPGDRALVATVWDQGTRSAAVKVLVRRSDLVPPYDDSAEVDGLGDTIRATCLGQPRWLKDSNTLELRPVYVYLS